jgi:maltose alpha-D-glucosyltransferase/alpha-amylase
MQWNKLDNAGFSAAAGDKLYAPVVSSPGFGPQEVNVADQLADPKSLLHKVREMIRVRKSIPALGTGDFSWAAVAASQSPNPIAAYIRESEKEKLLIIHNLSPDRQNCKIQLLDSAPATRVMGNGKYDIDNGQLLMELEPYGFLWLRIED